MLCPSREQFWRVDMCGISDSTEVSDFCCAAAAAAYTLAVQKAAVHAGVGLLWPVLRRAAVERDLPGPSAVLGTVHRGQCSDKTAKFH